jgi:2-polyprenyl-6-methoxyphenol hydroxylase-like FAD-dependent oxidoreductase
MGMRKWMQSAQKSPKRTNTYRKAILRFALLEQLGGHDKIKWGHQLVDLKEVEGETVELSFEVSGEVKIAKADLVVGADGIRSSVRKLLIGDSVTLSIRLYCDIGNLSFSCSSTVLIVRYWTRLRYFKLLMNEFTLCLMIQNQ